MANIIVTGGAGYIGSHTCKALALSGHTPVTYDNLSTGNRWAVRWGPLEEGDILDEARLAAVFARYRPRAVMHFAAASLVGESVREPALYYAANVRGGLNVLDACRAADCRAVVMSSTCAVYGTPARLPITEATPTDPINPYGASKLMLERILADYRRAYGIASLALRFFNAAGADADGEIGERRPSESHLVPLVLDAVTGLRPPVTVLGTDYPTPDGTAVRDYLHVSDIADVHLRALAHLEADGEGGAINIGAGQGASVNEVIAMAEAVTGRSVPRRAGARRPGDPPVLVADAEAATRLLGPGLLPRSDLATIVANAWAWQSSEAYMRTFKAAGASAAGT